MIQTSQVTSHVYMLQIYFYITALALIVTFNILIRYFFLSKTFMVLQVYRGACLRECRKANLTLLSEGDRHF